MPDNHGRHRTTCKHPHKGVRVRPHKKSRGICLTCYEWVNYTYETNGKVECYYCARGIKKS